MSISPVASMAEGTFAPSIVTQKITARMKSISGKPVHRLVSQRSSVRSISKPTRFTPVVCTPPAISSAAA